MNLNVEHQDPQLFESFKIFRNSSQSCQKFDDEAAELYALACLIDRDQKEVAGEIDDHFKKEFGCQILLKRIEVAGLPIKFTTTGLIAMLALTKGVPGKIVALLIDCLNTLPPDTSVTASKLSDVYPWGFYKEEVFEQYVDNVLKPKKINYSYLY